MTDVLRAKYRDRLKRLTEIREKTITILILIYEIGNNFHIANNT